MNWIRRNEQSIDRAIALASIVLPTPGTSSISRCPSAIRATSARRISCVLAPDDLLDVLFDLTESGGEPLPVLWALTYLHGHLRARVATSYDGPVSPSDDGLGPVIRTEGRRRFPYRLETAWRPTGEVPRAGAKPGPGRRRRARPVADAPRGPLFAIPGISPGRARRRPAEITPL